MSDPIKVIRWAMRGKMGVSRIGFYNNAQPKDAGQPNPGSAQIFNTLHLYGRTPGPVDKLSIEPTHSNSELGARKTHLWSDPKRKA